ncbi:MAG: phage tail tape measure protein, partial [Ornithinimicrobium sp.]
MPASNDVVWIDVLPSMARWTPTLTKQLGPESEKAGDSMGKRMSSGMSKALAGGVVGIGAVLTKGLLDNINIGKANDLLAAQMGTTVKASARIGKLAGSLYRDAYGESLEEVQSALRGVQSNIGDLSKFSNKEIEGMGAKALDLATIMGEDVSGVTRGVGQLIRNGLAKDATEGFDIITRAAQSVPETMQGELLETIEEYGADFSQLGLTGEQAMGAISAAVKAGARNTDLAADAFREFSIRAIDGSKATAEGYRALGLDADDMAQKIAAGGPVATEATSTIIRRLKGMSDPVKQEAAGVQ